jgi:hypothetical protein
VTVLTVLVLVVDKVLVDELVSVLVGMGVPDVVVV